LEYSDACNILNIMNGPWIEEPAKGTRPLMLSEKENMLILLAN